MKTRATSSLLAALAVVSLVLPALAADTGVPVEEPAEIEEVEEVRHVFVVDGEIADCVEYEVLNGVTYVTVSSFAAWMDPEAEVSEQGKTTFVSAATDVVTGEGETASVVTHELTLAATAGIPYIVANGRYLYAKDGVIQIDGHAAVPVRVMARVYNLDVGYDGRYDRVLVSHRAGTNPYLADASAIYDPNVLYWLSRVIYAESGNQSLEGKIAVGNVVMNRVKDPRFPNNIHDVLFQQNQFTTVQSSAFYREPSQESVVAAKLVIDGAEVVPTALFFNGVSVTRSYAAQNRTYVTTIGAHAFYK